LAGFPLAHLSYLCVGRFTQQSFSSAPRQHRAQNCPHQAPNCGSGNKSACKTLSIAHCSTQLRDISVICLF
jgi:hypothetical protein